jgi:poly(A) polymerase
MSNFKPAQKIDFEKFSKNFDSTTKKVLEIFTNHRVKARVVGGAVRDFLLNKRPRDIDLLVADDPAETLFFLEMYDLKPDTTGISHGTVKAVSGYGDSEVKVDITSLGYRIKLRGKVPHITHEKNWEIDSGMRDLSINSMSIDMNGNVWDYQNGIKDLNESRIRMLDYTKEHLEDDPNTILRYFKSLTYFPNPQLVKSDLELIKKNAYLLARSGDDERLEKNLLSIQSSPNSEKIIKLMWKMNIKKYFPVLPPLTTNISQK